MKDRSHRQRQSALSFPAAVVRQFAGSRIEKELLAQAFDVLWQGVGDRHEGSWTASHQQTGPGSDNRRLVSVSSLNSSGGWAQ